MRCPNCNTDLPDYAVFCGRCGITLAPATPPADAPIIVTPKKNKAKAVAAVLSAMAVLAVAAVVVTVFVLPMMGASAGAQLAFDISAPGVTGDSSPIPVHVNGTDAKGNAIDKTFGLNPSNPVLHLDEGSYDVSTAGPIMNADGSVGQPHEKTVHVNVVATSQSPLSKEYTAEVDGVRDSPVRLEYVQVAADRVTSDDVSAAKQWAANVDLGSYGSNAPDMNSYMSNYQAAFDSRYQVMTDAFTFDIPEYWRGKVRWEAKNGEAEFLIAGKDKPLVSEIKVYAAANSDKGLPEDVELCTIYTTVDEVYAGNVDTYYTFDGTKYEGVFTKIAVMNWTDGMDPDQPGLAYLVDLQTGGQGSVPDGYYRPSDGSFEALRAFSENELNPRITNTLTEAKAYDLKKAHYHVSTNYYEFDIPEYWWGKVLWSTSETTHDGSIPMTLTEVYFYDDASEKHVLLRVESYLYDESTAKYPDIWVGDVSYIALKEFNEDGRRTRITPADPAGVVKGAPHMMTNGWMKAADLSTGGTITSSSDLSNYSIEEIVEITKGFYNNEFMPSFKLK